MKAKGKYKENNSREHTKEYVTFDVMLDGRYVRTFRYKKNNAIGEIWESELRDFVISRMPSFKNKNFEICL